MSRIQLKELEASLISQVNDANNPFPIIGRMIPSYINGEVNGHILKSLIMT